jgi:acyl-CoA dehydrogenase
MGFIEETGAAQHLRDARITTIYEGTTGIQVNDLVGRKIARDGGRAARAAIAEMQAVASRLDGEEATALRAALEDALGALSRCVDWVVATHAADPRATAAGAVPLLKLFGIAAGGWQMAHAAIIARRKLAEGDNAERDFLMAKLGTAGFYADHVLPQASGLAHAVLHGARALAMAEDSWFES